MQRLNSFHLIRRVLVTLGLFQLLLELSFSGYRVGPAQVGIVNSRAVA